MTFTEFLRSIDIMPPEYLEEGKWQRVATNTHPKKKNAVIQLDEGGRGGVAKNFETMGEYLVWRSGDEKAEDFRSIDNAELSRKLAARKQEEIQGTMRAVAAYAKAVPLMHANHEYLRRKRCDMNGARGLKIDQEGNLIVPIWRMGKIVSIQKISPSGEKKMAYQAPSKAGHFQLWRPKPSVKVLCEGLVTGLSVFAAMPNAVVEVCFSAGNLIAVAERGDWSGMMAVAGDNDHATICQRHKKEGVIEPIDPLTPDRPEWCRCNPGKTDAIRAAKIIGCGWAVPACNGTDFNDFFCERLAILEKMDEQKTFRSSPFKLRQNALLPIKLALMSAAKPVLLKTRQ